MKKSNLSIFLTALFILFTSVSHAHEKKWPERRLRQTWPEAQSFTSKQVSLSSSQVADLAKEGVKIDSRQRSPIFYFAQAKGGTPDKPLGVILFIDALGSTGVIEVSVAMGANGQVAKVDLWEHSENPSLAKPEFLNQFVGKSSSDSFTINSDYKPVAGAMKASEAVANATRDALKISSTIFKKK